MKIGLFKIIKAFELDWIDCESSFFAGVVGVLCDTEDSAEVAGLFFQYVDLVSFIRRRACKRLCTGADISAPRRMIKPLEWAGKLVFDAYQASSLGTQKWHILHHLGSAMSMLVVSNNGMAAVFKVLIEVPKPIIKLALEKDTTVCASLWNDKLF